MNVFNFNPVEGLLNKESFPSRPESEEQARGQIQTPLNQLKDFINNTIVTSVNALEGFKNNGGTIGGNTTINGNLVATGSITTTGNLSGKDISLSGNATITGDLLIGTSSKQQNGCTEITNGLVLQWGTISCTQATSTTVTFTFPFSSTVFPILITPSNSNAATSDYYVSSKTNSNFVLNYSESSTLPLSFNWWAIGF